MDASRFCPERLAPLGPAHHHVDLAAPAPGTDEPCLPLEDRDVGAVAAAELGRIRLDLAAAISSERRSSSIISCRICTVAAATRNRRSQLPVAQLVVWKARSLEAIPAAATAPSIWLACFAPFAAGCGALRAGLNTSPRPTGTDPAMAHLGPLWRDCLDHLLGRRRHLRRGQFPLRGRPLRPARYHQTRPRRLRPCRQLSLVGPYSTNF
jgi:hypothetical protein